MLTTKKGHNTMSTKEKLATALEKAEAPEWMVKNARNGQYDDFESSIATPIAQLVEDAIRAGLEDIALEAMKGEFDSTKEEADAWYTREGKDLLL